MLWHKMHALVGIEVGYPKESLLLSYEKSLVVPTTVNTPNAMAYANSTIQSINPKKSRHRNWQTRYGNIHPLHCLVGIDVEKLDRMPQQAVILLVSINDSVAQYVAWQQSQTKQPPTKQKSETNVTMTNWLTEKQFVIEKLIQQTIPEAVAQYDQLARFSPDRLSQQIHDNMTAGDILVAVLQTVDNQMTTVLDDVFAQASSQLATTYRYVKTRTQL